MVIYISSKQKSPAVRFLIYVLCGISIGVGAVLPGISGGVLCVVFGIYKPIMDFLSSPVKTFKSNVKILLPTFIGITAGFLGVSKLLNFFLSRYPNESVSIFIGLIFGMLPSLFAEAGERGRGKKDILAFCIGFSAIFTTLLSLEFISFKAEENFLWYLFAGFSLALSVIVPGMSFSTLLMPMGLYDGFIEGIGNFDFAVLMPAGIGAVLTLVLLSKLVAYLMNRYYSIAMHLIIGIVIAATLMIIPIDGISDSIMSTIVNLSCMSAGFLLSLLLSKLQRKNI